ncbi:Uncharacterised protein [Campylobacter jejuni]|nr:Uncharacterised protein [Campylobacter jejuni]
MRKGYPNANAMYLPIEDGKKPKGHRYSFKRKTSLARLSYEILSALLNEVGVRTRNIFLL